jgi:hypothetical protein
MLVESLRCQLLRSYCKLCEILIRMSYSLSDILPAIATSLFQRWAISVDGTVVTYCMYDLPVPILINQRRVSMGLLGLGNCNDQQSECKALARDSSMWHWMKHGIFSLLLIIMVCVGRYGQPCHTNAAICGWCMVRGCIYPSISAFRSKALH